MAWNSYEYSAKPRKARRNYRCDACGGLIFKGEEYDSTYGGVGHEHISCPDTPEERVLRECRTAQAEPNSQGPEKER